jgi:hypothetical protein
MHKNMPVFMRHPSPAMNAIVFPADSGMLTVAGDFIPNAW